MTKNAIEKSSDNQLHDNFAVYCASGELYSPERQQNYICNTANSVYDFPCELPNHLQLIMLRRWDTKVKSQNGVETQVCPTKIKF